MVGDEAFDATHDFLRNLSAVYREAFGRNPTLEELIQLLEIELRVSGGEFLTDLDERRVTKITVKTERKPRDQAFASGDVFAIPIEAGTFAFGRIMIIDKQRGMLIEIFREVARSPSHRPSIPQSGRLFHPVKFADSAAFKEWRWRVVASDGSYRLSEADEALEFASPGPVKGWCVVGFTAKILRYVSEAEAATMERGWSWTHAQLEARIRAAIAG
jgi:hypothetical protein